MFERSTIIFEAFSFAERLRVIEEQPRCAICGIEFCADTPPEIHSKTSLHIVDGVATSPRKYPRLKNRNIGWKVKGGDGVALCIECHDELHRMHGDEATVKEILELTEFMIRRGKW